MADMCQSCGLPRNNHNVYHQFVSLKTNSYIHIENKNTEVCKICGICKNDHLFLIHEYAK